MHPSSQRPSTALQTPICPVCGTSISERPFLCPHCETPHHQDCWDYNGGCATYGCSGVPGGLRRGRTAMTLGGNTTASTGARVVAYIIDWFLLYVAFGGMTIAAETLLKGMLPYFLLHALPWLGLTALWLLRDCLAGGRSPGKAILGIEVEQPDETSTSFRNSVLRNVPLALPSLTTALAFTPGLAPSMQLAAALTSILWFIEVILVMGSGDGRRLGDRLAGTTVVNRPRLLPPASAEEIRFLGTAETQDSDDGITIVSTTTARDRWGKPADEPEE